MVNSGLTSTKTTSLVINPIVPATLYAGTASGIFRSTDSGAHWLMVNSGLTSISVTSLAIDPVTPSTLYAGTNGGGVFCSTDSGDHWTSMNSGLTSQSVISLAIDPLTPGILYAGTDGGVFRYGAVSSSKSIIQLKIGSKTMYENGKPVPLEAAPIILNSRTLLPIRAVVEAAGGTVAWDASAQKVTVVRQDKTLELWISKNAAKLNGQSVNIDINTKVVPVIVSGRTLLPLRFVAEALGFDIQWNGATQTITITYTP
jgi:ligand-binding sensor domain-containing protein